MNESAHTQQQKQFKILLIGDDGLDVYQFGSVDRISPEAPVPVFKHSHETHRSGMARNVCDNLEALGCHVNYLHGQTSIKTRLIDIRSKQQIVRIDNDVTSDPISFETAIPPVYDAIVVSDYDKGTIGYELLYHLAKAVTIPVFIDTKKKDLSLLNGCYVKINELEKSRATKLPSPEWLIVTHGDKGVTWDGWAFGAIPVEVADVCGAGDTFLAALVYEYLNTNDMHTAISFAIRASAVTVQHLGCYAPKLEEIK